MSRRHDPPSGFKPDSDAIASGVRLHVDPHDFDADAQSVQLTQHVPILVRHFDFGGWSPFWECPGCHARRRMLHGPLEGSFQCASCHRLSYQSGLTRRSSLRLRALSASIHMCCCNKRNRRATGLPMTTSPSRINIWRRSAPARPSRGGSSGWRSRAGRRHGRETRSPYWRTPPRSSG